MFVTTITEEMPFVVIAQSGVRKEMTWSDLDLLSKEINDQMREFCAKLHSNRHYCVHCGLPFILEKCDGTRHAQYNDPHRHRGCLDKLPVRYLFCHGCGASCNTLFCADCSGVNGEYTVYM